MTGTHPRSENFPWTIVVVDHPPRKESTEYIASRKLMRKIVAQVDDWVLGPPPYEDHHGGSVWVKDEEGWLCTQLPLGIEWSAQFAADPAKVDKLRVMAARIITAFPGTVEAYEEYGYDSERSLLKTEITSARHVARWTDSIFNASMPVPRAVHTGVLPKGAGYHHYPKPIVDIDHFRRDDLPLFVDDDDGHPWSSSLLRRGRTRVGDCWQPARIQPWRRGSKVPLRARTRMGSRPDSLPRRPSVRLRRT